MGLQTTRNAQQRPFGTLPPFRNMPIAGNLDAIVPTELKNLRLIRDHAIKVQKAMEKNPAMHPKTRQKHENTINTICEHIDGMERSIRVEIVTAQKLQEQGQFYRAVEWLQNGANKIYTNNLDQIEEVLARFDELPTVAEVQNAGKKAAKKPKRR